MKQANFVNKIKYAKKKNNNKMLERDDQGKSFKAYSRREKYPQHYGAYEERFYQ